MSFRLEEKGLTERKKQGIWELKRIAFLVLGNGFCSMTSEKESFVFHFCVLKEGWEKESECCCPFYLGDVEGIRFFFTQ